MCIRPYIKVTTEALENTISQDPDQFKNPIFIV